jgi:hypothetical protein
MKNTILFACVLLVLTSSCKKGQQFPEDTERTSLTPYERIYGKWQLTKVELNGVDMTAEVLDSFGQYQLEFMEEREFGAKVGIINAPKKYNKISSIWHLNDIYIQQSPQISVYPDLTKFMVLGCYYMSIPIYWEIRSLSTQNLKIQKIVNDSTMINYFKKL